ncbi:acyltransferase [Methanofollis ethanolicus]|uniref:acyltransferase n=1 Tax=Methanofollis ethanolicus TaxID=488124 RepID=UPI0009F9C1B5|nr:acyltransferase [Methanofollis ethanolicus]
MIKSFIRNCIVFFARRWGLPDPSLVIFKSDYPDGKLVGEPAQIGAFSVIDYGGGVFIGKNVKIGYGVIILSVSTITGSKNNIVLKKPVYIGDDAEIGSNVVVLPGVKIGKNATIGAGAVVTENVPDDSVAVGMPAHIVRIKSDIL